MSNPPRLRDFLGFQRPRSSPFAPADRPGGPAGLSVSGARLRRPCRRRERPWAALNLYRKFSQARLVDATGGLDDWWTGDSDWWTGGLCQGHYRLGPLCLG